MTFAFSSHFVMMLSAPVIALSIVSMVVSQVLDIRRSRQAARSRFRMGCGYVVRSTPAMRATGQFGRSSFN